MKLAFLAAGNSIHTIKWVNALAKRGHEIHLITMHNPVENLVGNIFLHILRFPSPFGYYLNLSILKRKLNLINPDLLHTHYASGYGTLARLVRFKPLLLSVWGSDVYEFPENNHINKYILSKNLAAADYIYSTSHNMKMQTERYIKPKNPINVVPFGVDLNVFFPKSSRDSGYITIGMVKRMAPIYGPEFLLQAFASISSKYPNARLIFVGGGPQEDGLKKMAKSLNISEDCHFIGSVPHDEVPKLLNRFDIFCAPSISESFGVAVIEASACGLPVIVSNVGGLPEVVKDGETGIIVPLKNVNALAQALELLIEDKELRLSMGEHGRRYIQQLYDWDFCVDKMEQCYDQVLKEYSDIRRV